MAARKDNGQGTIYFDEKKGYWYAQIRWTDSSNTKRTKTFSGKTKAGAKKKLDDFKKELLLSGPDIGKKSVTLKEFAENWMKTKLRLSLKPSSFMRKKVTFAQQVYPHLGNIPIDAITSNDIQKMVNALVDEGLAYSTIKKAFDNVNGCLREYRIVTRNTGLFNPCEAVTLPVATKRSDSDITFYNENERKAIRTEAVRTFKNGTPVYRHGHGVIVLMYTGMRLGELIALEWSDIDFENRTISITKNSVVVEVTEGESKKYKLIDQNSAKTYSGSRVIPMTQVARDSLLALQTQNKGMKYVLSTRNGTQVSPRNVARMFNSILHCAGIIAEGDDSYNLHALRHTFASMMFANGAEVKTVSDILGHANTKITENIYIHMIQKIRVKAIQDIDKYSS